MKLSVTMPDSSRKFVDCGELPVTIKDVIIASVQASRAFVISCDDRIASFPADKEALDAGVTDFASILPDGDAPVQQVCHSYPRIKPTEDSGAWQRMFDMFTRYLGDAWFAPDLQHALHESRVTKDDSCLFGRYFKVSVKEDGVPVHVATVIFQ